MILARTGLGVKLALTNIGGGGGRRLNEKLQVPPIHKKSQFDFFVYYSSD